MAESSFTVTSTVTVDSIVIDASSPLDSEVLVFNGTQFVTDPPVPVGTIEIWGGLSSSMPYGWLLCDGQQVLSSSALGQVLSTRYNTGGETAGNVRVPNMSGVWPVGIASGGAGGSTTTAYSDANVAHTHASFTTSAANTNADGSNHWHNLASAGDHSMSTSAENFTHLHNTGVPSNTHFHNTNGANIAFINTGGTAHISNQHGNSSNDGASHTHNSNTEVGGHYHDLYVGNQNNTTHSHTWNSNSISSAGINAPGGHYHSVNLVSVCFIIKY